MLSAILTEKKWLYREFNVFTPEGVFDLAYDGTGMGFESVLINGKIVARETSYFWYVPEFDFRLGTQPAKISVSVSWRLTIKRLNFEVNNRVLYSEG